MPPPSTPLTGPHQYPDASQEGESKYDWYKRSRYGDSDEKMRMYQTLMTAYGRSAGIDFKFGGTVANTIDAHRVIQHFQDEKGPEAADNIINSLYKSYFESESHPSSPSTLLHATAAAGIPPSDAEPVIADRSARLRDTKIAIRQQASNGVDSVPHVVLDGKRRDLTLVGAKEVDEYERALATVLRESK